MYVGRTRERSFFSARSLENSSFVGLLVLWHFASTVESLGERELLPVKWYLHVGAVSERAKERECWCARNYVTGFEAGVEAPKCPSINVIHIKFDHAEFESLSLSLVLTAACFFDEDFPKKKSKIKNLMLRRAIICAVRARHSVIRL